MGRQVARGSGFLLGPFAVLADEVHQTVHGFSFGKVELYRCLADGAGGV